MDTPLNLTTLAENLDDKPAVVMTPSGEAISYQALEVKSNRIARLMYEQGLRPGDHIAILMENRLEYLLIVWAAQRSGILYTPVNWHLGESEAAYIVNNCDARMLFYSPALDGERIAESCPSLQTLFAVGDDECHNLENAINDLDSSPLPAECEGYYMFYSSGTTGKPKGILPKRIEAPFGTGLPIDHRMAEHFGFDSNSVYLSTGPLYHAAPLAWTLGTIRNGGTAVVMERFDPADALEAIDRHHVTHAQFVPTMFVRLLKLDPRLRSRYDVSSLRLVVHSAAPCPPDIKRSMIEWLGPIVVEFYGASEGTGFFTIDADDWLAHPGSVGRPLRGRLHICDDNGDELRPGQVGTVWFSDVGRFEYHRDPARTAEAFNDRGWNTLGDLGHVDDEGYLYLSARRTDLIISGGVNIYPQEIEDVIITHPAVLDVAVVGQQDDDLGQTVHARVTPVDERQAAHELEADIIAYCRIHLARFKCPRSVSFGSVPRLPSGKILRRRLLEN